MDDPEVQHILDIISSTPLTNTEHKLLLSFVKDSVLPEATAAYILERISLGSKSKQSVEFALRRVLTDWEVLVERFRKPAPPPLRCSQSVLRRDRGLCCLTDRSSLWWDILGWSRIVTANILPNDLLLIYENPEYAPLQELLTHFIGKEQVQRLKLMLSVESKSTCRNHWALRRDAATAFREGLVYLTPRWDIHRHPDEDFKSNCKYTLWTTMPTPSLPTTSKEQTLRSGTQIEMFTCDPVSAPLPSAFLFGIHARFCNSLRALHIDRETSSRRPNLVLEWAKKIRNVCIARAFPWVRFLWAYVPRQGRIFVYRMLLSVGARMYGKSNLWTQRVPFGLYIKHGRGELIPKGEGPALQLVEHYTNIPTPKLIEALVDGGYTYLVMTRVTGQPLIQAIYTMGYPERKALASELSRYVGQLASIPNRNKAAICDANGGPVFDYRLEGRLAGPFESEADFNNFIITQARLRVPSHDRPHKICFTHADLNPNNILVESGRLSGIVDFGCAGYYPEYWEFTKAVFSTPGLDSSFLALFEDTFGDSYRDELEAERDLWLVRNPF